jgi:Zn-finger nucleic acid-binding protein
MRPRVIHDVVIDDCSQCHGAFLDALALKLLAEENAARTDALLALVSTATEPATSRVMTNLRCPLCGVTMQRKLSETGAGIVVDMCAQHGTYFDDGELPRLLTFALRQAQEQATLAQEHDDHARRLEAHDAAINSNVVMRGTIRGLAAVGEHFGKFLEALAHDGDPPPHTKGR